MINDTTEFFSTDDFAEQVTVNGRKCKAIYDRVAVQHEEGFAIVKGYAPRLTIQTVDVVKANAVQGSPVVVRKSNYEITDIEDDGTGITTLFLFEQR